MPTQDEFLAEIARKVAASDAKADADLADILAGRPFHRSHPPKAETEANTAPPAPRKPRAKRAPAKRKPATDDLD
ncbi:MAG TPA: hypothetical protein VHD90_15190 [Phototrophicaceae bacterium]|nr:hypothetical protein [Phototrophicaceae bacterium]